MAGGPGGGSPPRASPRATVRVLGCGDAFGSGGRLQTCFLVEAGVRYLLDCGASALLAMKRFGVDPDAVDAIVLTHLHGDHFGGVPFLVRETQIAAARTRPLTVVGPPGHEERIRQTMELLFPGSPAREPSFALSFVEYHAGEPIEVAGLTVTAAPVRHTAGTNPHAVRVTSGGATVAYSGDTEWVDALVPIAAGADLFVCECYRVEPGTRNHLDYRTLMAHRHELRCRRLLLTHMHDEVLALEDPDAPERAGDGMEIVL